MNKINPALEVIFPLMSYQPVKLHKTVADVIVTLTRDININSLLRTGTDYSVMRNLELAYWNYIDNYCPSVNCTFRKFMNMVFQVKGVTDFINDIASYSQEYERLKRSIPTSGTIIVDDSIPNDPYVLMVRVHKSPVFSLPKGKHERISTPPGFDVITDLKGKEYESSQTAAIRETMEETGILLKPSDLKASFVVESSNMFVVFVNRTKVKMHKRDYNEIPLIQWIKAKDVLKYPFMYSKMVPLSIRLLIRHNLIECKIKDIPNDV